VKPDVAPVRVIEPVPVFRQVGAMTIVSLGCRTPLPEASTASANGATA
jgi:hypothetical protein